MASCSICDRRVLAHAYRLTCAVCQNETHLKCLSGVSKKDKLFKDKNVNNWFGPCCIESALPFNHFIDDDDFLTSVLEFADNKLLIGILDGTDLLIVDNWTKI